MNNTIVKTFYAAIIIVVPVILGLMINPSLPQVNPNLEISIVNNDGTSRLQVWDKSGKYIKKAIVYRNNKEYIRAFEPTINNYTKGIDQAFITFVFDDGWLDVYENAYPVLRKYNYPASVALVGNYVDKPGALSSRQIDSLVKNGWDIVAHAIEDKSLLDLSADQQEKDISDSKLLMWEKYWATEYLMYPFGEFDDQLEEVTKKYYKGARGYEEGLNNSPINPYEVKIVSLDQSLELHEVEDYVDDAIVRKSWLVFVGHHVSDTQVEEFGYFTIETLYLNEVAKLLLNKQVKVVTFNQAIQEITPNNSLIQNGQLFWEFDSELLGSKSADIFVVIDGKRTKTINI